MKIRRLSKGGQPVVQIGAADGWVDAADALRGISGEYGADKIAQWSADTVALLAAPDDVRASANEAAKDLEPSGSDAPLLLPFEPKSFRDFMLYERHAIDAARGFVRRFMPGVMPLVRAYEAMAGAPFPALKPHTLWYRQPIYYMGNHLAFATEGETVEMPSYTHALDYELELGFVLAHGLFNASPEDAERAIGGFVIVNDFSARDVQRAEMRSGFGPQKAKHFRNGISACVVSADEILPRWRNLQGCVRINGQLISRPSSAGARWSLGEALAHASRDERLYPGELFATGTLPGGCGIETGRLLAAGDTIELSIEGVGSLTNRIAAKGGAS